MNSYIHEELHTSTVKNADIIQSIESVNEEQNAIVDITESKDEEVAENLAGACPMCGGPLKYESGCVACALNCGYSECG